MQQAVPRLSGGDRRRALERHRHRRRRLGVARHVRLRAPVLIARRRAEAHTVRSAVGAQREWQHASRCEGVHGLEASRRERLPLEPHVEVDGGGVAQPRGREHGDALLVVDETHLDDHTLRPLRLGRLA